MSKKIIITIAAILSAASITACGSNKMRIDLTAEFLSNNGTPTINIESSLPDSSVVEVSLKNRSSDTANVEEQGDVLIESGHASIEFDNEGKGFPNGEYALRFSIIPDKQPEEIRKQMGDIEKDVILANGIDLRPPMYGDNIKYLYKDMSVEITDSEVVIEAPEEDPAPILESEAKSDNEKDDSAAEDFWASMNTPEKKLKDYIQSRVRNEYDRTTVNRVEINEDLGTDAEGDYITLIYLTWDVKNKADMTEKMLQMYSDDMAASLANDHPEVQEVALFWKVPYLGTNTSKWSYERINDGMYLNDKVLGF